MQFLTYIPQAPLSTFINKIWLYENHHPLHQMECTLPHGSVELIINLYQNHIHIYDRDSHARLHSLKGCIISGPKSEYSIIDTDCQIAVIGVQFHHGGASPLLRIPLHELHNTDISLDALWGTMADELRDHLVAASTPMHKFQIIEHFLLTRLTHPIKQHPAVHFALKHFQTIPHTHTITEIVRQIGFSQKHFIHIFREAVGLTPKVFCRLQRFQTVLHSIAQQQEIDWADVAISCGYFDQAHFIHDFRAFSGLYPSGYIKQRGDHINHVSL